jgi:hypothetical protein
VKSSVFLILFALFISCSNTAIDLSGKKEAHTDDNIKKESKDIPDIVLMNFQAKYPHASTVKWEKEEDIFNVEFILVGQEYEDDEEKKRGPSYILMLASDRDSAANPNQPIA